MSNDRLPAITDALLADPTVDPADAGRMLFAALFPPERIARVTREMVTALTTAAMTPLATALLGNLAAAVAATAVTEP